MANRDANPEADSAAQLSADPDRAIGKRIKDARDAKGLTQAQLSARSKSVDPESKGVSRTALVGYEAGSSRPGLRELRIICECLHVTPNHLIYGSEHPFQASHFALEGLRNKRRQVYQSFQVAFVVMALKDHERDALMSLALSLGGRQLGDERLSGLRAMAGTVAGNVLDSVRTYFQEMSDEEFGLLPLQEIADRMSRELSTNIGTGLRFNDDGEVIGGRQEYPDPEQ